MLKTIIPDTVLRTHRCLVLHPGPKGDRGPSSLDWAIELGDGRLGRDGARGDRRGRRRRRLGTRTFRTREAGKSSLYRHEVRRAAVEAVTEAVTAVAAGERAPEPVDYGDPRRDRPPRAR